MENEIFSVQDLTVNYDKNLVLWDISFSITSPQLIGIIGPNGAGKSTLLKTALGMIKPLSGCIRFWQKPFSFVRKKIAYVPQKESIDWNFPITAFEVVLMGRYGKLKFLQRPREVDKKAVQHVLKRVGLTEFQNRQISELSGGQQQRLFLARALVQEADLYLLDEPFQGVDMATEKTIMDILKKLRDEGKTIFVVHHVLLSLEHYFDYLIMLNTRLVAHGPIEKVLLEENFLRTYGKNPFLFDEAASLSLRKRQGF